MSMIELFVQNAKENKLPAELMYRIPYMLLLLTGFGLLWYSGGFVAALGTAMMVYALGMRQDILEEYVRTAAEVMKQSVEEKAKDG